MKNNSENDSGDDPLKYPRCGVCGKRTKDNPNSIASHKSKYHKEINFWVLPVDDY